MESVLCSIARPVRRALYVLALGIYGAVSGIALQGAERAANGLQVLYDFRGAEGATVQDRSGADSPVHLGIADTNAVRWTDGGLEVHGKTLIRSSRAATRVSDSIRLSGRFTMETWVRPAAVDQSGPARIVTLSPSGSVRNFTLGQDGSRFEVRMRTSQTSDNGLPSMSTPAGSVTTNLTHLVFTRDRNGRARIYLDGKLSVEQTIPGNTVNWDGSYQLALANELSRDRSWQGTYQLVAIYSRDLLPEEVQRHFEAGPSPAAPRGGSASANPNGEQLLVFEREIVPILSRYCLECHDSAIQKGRLDLSHKAAAFAGSSSGSVIIPGDAAKSVLWTMIESDEMPENRPPVPAREKELLKQWIEQGAAWSAETIDPAAHRLSRQTRQSWLRRLTVPEYIETVRSAVKVDIASEARDLLPKDLRADGFSNTAYNLGVDLSHVEAYATLADLIVERMDVGEFTREFSKAQNTEVENLRDLTGRMGRWLFRGPLEEREIQTFMNVANAAVEQGGDFNGAAGILIEAMLQAPRFLYRVENQRGDGTPWPVDDYELAARLSYTLWGAPPDRELMRAVEAGELYDRRQVEAQVRRMLEDPRVISRSLRFASEWLDLDRLDNLRPNSEKFPQWSTELAADMRNETLAFFEEVVWKQKRPLADLLNAQVTYLTRRLAEFYGLPALGGGAELARYSLEDVPGRGGLLTQGSLLTIGGDEASMVTRGLFVLNDVLRGAINNPPPGLDTSPVPAKPGISKRGVAQGRVDNPSCGACHVRFEPLAYAFEKYDGVGVLHEQDEYGNVLREDGEVLFPGEGQAVQFKTVSALMDLLAGHERVRENLSRKLIQFAIGRPLTSEDSAAVSQIHRQALAGGGTYGELMRAIVLSELVLSTQTEVSENGPEKS